MLRVFLAILALTLCIRAHANVANGTFSAAIKKAPAWTCGTDDDRVWFSDAFTNTDSFAALPNTGGKTRALLQSIPMPAQARYRVTFQARATDPKKQDAFLLVLAVRNGVKLDLGDDAFTWDFAASGTRVVARVQVPNNASKMRTRTVSLNVNVSAQDARRYDNLVFVLVGSCTKKQELEFDNVSTDVPYPSASGDDAPIHADWFLAPNTIRSLAGVNWDTPFLTTNETQLNWPNSARPFHPQVRADRFALRARGSFIIPQDGLWTFYVGSDEGITLDINATRVVNADQIQKYTLRSGSIILPRGTHTFDLHYFERTGNNALVLFWQGPADPIAETIPEGGFDDAPLAQRTRVTRWEEIPND